MTRKGLHFVKIAVLDVRLHALDMPLRNVVMVSALVQTAAAREDSRFEYLNTGCMN